MIELLCVDVDGTLTDGRLVYGYSWVGNLSLDSGNSFSGSHSADLLNYTHPLTPSAREGEFFSSLRDSHSESKQSKTRESKSQSESKIEKRINADSSQVCDSQNAQGLPNKLPRESCGFLSNDENIANPKATSDSAEVSLDNFVGFLPSNPLGQARNCEIEHRVHRAVECAESSDCAKETIAPITEIAKSFNVKDGLALAYWCKSLNRKVAIITGRSSEILRVRADELGIGDLLFMGVRDKGKILRELKQRFTLESAQIAAVGDDLNDIPMFAESSLNFAPNDCTSAFKDGALKSLPNITILNAKGGCGAVREAIEMILQKEGLYEEFVSQFV